VKTISLKKVSAVAVASLGFGLLSVVPAQASAADVVSIYASKYSVGSNFTATFPGTSAAVSAAGTAVTLVSGTFTSTAVDAGKAIYNVSTTGGYIGTIATVTSATAITLVSGATSALVAGNTGLAASLVIGTPVTTTTASTIINADGISGMTATGGSAAAVMVKLSNPEGTATTAKVRYIIDNAGVMGTSPAIPAAATTAFVPFTVPSTAGTYTGKLQYSVAGTFLGTAADQIDINFTLTVTAATTLSTSLSTAYMTAPSAGGTSASSTTNGVARSAYKTANTGISQVKVTLLKADGTAETAAHTVTATVSGAGFVSVDVTADTPGTPATRTATNSAGASVRYVHINSDGTAGSGTVTVSVTHAVTAVTTTLGTFSYTSYDDVAALTVSTTNFSIGKSGSAQTTGGSVAARTVADNLLGAMNASTTTPAFVIKATDSAGRVVNTVLAPSVVSLTSPAVASGGTCTLDNGALPTTASSSTNGIGYYNCNFTTSASSKTGDKATLTIRVTDPADATKYISTTFDITVGSSTVSTEVISFDKLSYAPGEAMVVTRTAKDSSGNPVADGTASPVVSFSKAVGGTVPAAGFYRLGASASSTSAATASVFAPTVPGAFSALATTGATGGATITASASVTDANAGLLTQIDALNAKIVALNALIAKIMKKLGVK
jgi:hypothetical protein